MILVDYSAVSIGNITANRAPPDENLIRHMILNTLRSYNKKYRDKYGQMYLCCDSNSWRRDYFKFYKYSRRKDRSESSIDWDEMFRIINKITDEIGEYLPWAVIKVNGAEADDVIASLALSTQELGKNEPVMIIAADSDYKQLHSHSNIKQWSTITKKMVTEKEPHRWLFEACVRGQGKDGVPNIFSPHDFYKRKADGEDVGRQKSVSKKKLADLWDNRKNLETYLPPEQWSAFVRNRKLMSFNEIPEDLIKKIIDTAESYESPGFSRVMSYLIKYRCTNLMENLNDFKANSLS